MRKVLLDCALFAISCGSPAIVWAQDPDPSTKELVDEMRQLGERLQALERQHRTDQERISQLEERIRQMDERPLPAAQSDEIEETKPDVQTTPDQSGSTSGMLDLSGGATSGLNAFNPQLTVFVDTGGSLSSDSSNKALNRFNLREVEIDLRAAISPQADGALILSIPEEIESEPNGDVDISYNLEIEEGFINFHTLPFDTALKVGKFRAAFGRNNLLHTHDLPQVTRPLVVQSFFGPEGLAVIGASFSWLVPNPWNQYVELVTEVVNADGGEESPIMGGPNADNPAVIGHLSFFRDISSTSSFDAGLSYLFTDTSSSSDFEGQVFGLDASYSWVHPDPSKFRSLLLQSEFLWAHNDVDQGFFASGRNSSFGTYTFAQYQLLRDWYVGLRGDYTQFPNSQTRGTSDWDAAMSPYVSWYITEFMRLRLEYQHRISDVSGDTGSEEAIFLQFTGVFGSHPAHPYWVHR